MRQLLNDFMGLVLGSEADYSTSQMIAFYAVLVPLLSLLFFAVFESY